MEKRARFTFSQEGRTCLTPQEAVEWRNALKKILKVGFEHECNLKDYKGECRGDSFFCPCSHPEKEQSKCYSKCLLGDINTCAFAKEYGECPGVYCIEFVSPCHTCKKAVRDCTVCKLFEDPEKKPDAIRKRMTEALKPTNDISKIGDHGVLQVTTDGSLVGNGGVEIPTVGRRVNYNALYKQSKKIIDMCMKEGAFINARTSLHIHLVTQYYMVNGGKAYYNKGDNEQGGNNMLNELETNIPEIVLANFHQLVRRYHNALTWITSSGTDLNRLTRYAKFREPVLKYSAQKTKMNKVVSELNAAIGNNGRYGFINYCKMGFDNGGVSKLHLEARFPDNVFSPSAASSFGVLIYAMMVKSVLLSQFGTLFSGSREYMDEASTICSTLLNNMGPEDDQRTSDTSKFHLYTETVRAQAIEMVSLLEKELREEGNSFHVLMKLAEKPCSLRLCEGKSWDDIEKDLLGDLVDLDNKTVSMILEATDTAYITDCVNQEEWVSVVSEDNGVDKKTVSSCIQVMEKNGMIRWNTQSGCFVRQ
jgi:hypothetical protein